MKGIVEERGLIKTWLIILFPKLHCRIDGHLQRPDTMFCRRCSKIIDIKKDKIDWD